MCLKKENPLELAEVIIKVNDTQLLKKDVMQYYDNYKATLQYGADEAERILAWKPQRFITVRPNTLRISAAEFEARLDKLELRWATARRPRTRR